MTLSYIFPEWRRTAIEGKQPRDELDAGLEYKILKLVEFMGVVDPNLNLGSRVGVYSRVRGATNKSTFVDVHGDFELQAAFINSITL